MKAKAGLVAWQLIRLTLKRNHARVCPFSYQLLLSDPESLSAYWPLRILRTSPTPICLTSSPLLLLLLFLLDHVHLPFTTSSQFPCLLSVTSLRLTVLASYLVSCHVPPHATRCRPPVLSDRRALFRPPSFYGTRLLDLRHCMGKF